MNWFAAHQVKGLVLRGIFGLRRSELLFFYQEGSSWLFPDAWEKVPFGLHPRRRNRTAITSGF